MPMAKSRHRQQRRNAAPAASPVIACEDCGKEFKSHYILILHARYHRKESNYIFQRNSSSAAAAGAGALADEVPEEPRQAPQATVASSAIPPLGAAIGQVSPPQLPNPAVPTPAVQPPDADGDEEYSADEVGGGGRLRVGGLRVDEDEDDDGAGVGVGAEEDEMDDEEETAGEELECEICDARFHQVLELLKHIRAHRYELTESNYQQYRRKIVTTYRPSDVRVDLRRLADEAADPGDPTFGGAAAGGRGGDMAGARSDGSAAAAAAAGTEYECDYCGKRFPTASNLRRHIPVHTGERPHQCPFCGCRFGDRSYMLKHTRFVHNVELARVQKAKTRPRYASSACFKCQICNRYFENGDILAVHLEKYHSRPDHGSGPRRNQPAAGAAGDAAAAGDEEYPPDDEDEEDAAMLEEEGQDAGAEDDDEVGMLGGRGRHRQRQQTDTETLFSCDQCEFISADLAQLHAHLAEHAAMAPAVAVLADDSKPRLTVTISDG